MSTSHPEWNILLLVGSNRHPAIRKIVEDTITCRDNALITDFDGRLLAEFCRLARGDDILGDDSRSANWAFIDDFKQLEVVDWLCRYAHLTPQQRLVFARAFETFCGVVVRELRKAHKQGYPVTAREIYRVLTQEPVVYTKRPFRRMLPVGLRKALLRIVSRIPILRSFGRFLPPFDGLQALLKNTEAESYTQPDSRELLDWVRAAAAEVLRGFEHLHPREGGRDLSVADWAMESRARKQAGTGNLLFLSYKPGTRSLASLLRTWVVTAMFALIKTEPDPDICFRLIFDVDDCERIPELLHLVLRMHLVGVQLVLCVDSLDRFRVLYGKEADQIIHLAEVRHV